MRFIIDAQLPPGLKKVFSDLEMDAIHTDDLPDKNRTTDNQICEISVLEERIVVTKDYDFVDTHYIAGIPRKLILISTGNIKNKELFDLLNSNIGNIINALETGNLIEINNQQIIVHG
jgi:predicted nuclease of predicted toxin-antitoxin system